MAGLAAGLSFFSTLNLGGDFEEITKNLYLMPLIGAIIGLIIGIPAYILSFAGLGFLVFLFYVAVEGINHIDGLADFFDAVFAPQQKKISALKDLNIGSGGSLAVASYSIFLIIFFGKISYNEILPAVVLSQTLAKQAMLLLVLRMDPLWDGMASEFGKNKSRRDYFSILISLAIGSPFILFWGEKVVVSFLVFLIITFFFERYVRMRFGGMSGDMLGALNCITFSSILGVWACWQL